MPSLRDYFQYRRDYIVSEDAAKSRSYFFESTDLNQDGKKDVIFFGFTYPNVQVTTAIPQKSLFYWGDRWSGYTLGSAALIGLPETTHPREIAYADFNNDGVLDIFLADHGWDTNPFPGGQNQLILSSAAGWTLSTANLPLRLDFTHCTSVGDINKDGNIDIFLGNVDTSSSPVNASILLGDGTGRFVESTTVVPSEIRGSIRFYAAQLTDLNQDSWVDLVIGNSGDAGNSKSKSIVYWNDQGRFDNANCSLLPNGYFGARNEQILDIQTADLNGDGKKDLVLLSTQNNPFYDGWSLQILSNHGNEFVDITTDSFSGFISSMGTPNRLPIVGQSPWIAFVKLVDVNNDGTTDILFDSIQSYSYLRPESIPLMYLNDGFAHFTPIFADEVLDLNSSYRDFFSKASVFVGESGVSWLNYFSWRDSIYFRELLPTKPLPKVSTITGTVSSDQISGNELNNLLTGLAGNDTIFGGAGLDTVVFSGLRSQYSLSAQGADGFRVTDSVAARNGTDTVSGVERLRFSDTSLALDLDGNAGKVAKILGTIFGPSSVSNKTYVGIGLGLMDDGMSYEALAALAVSVTGKSSSTDVCTLLWTNVIGSAPTTADIAPFKAMLDSGQMSIGGLAALAADTSFNTTNIDLVGLARTGLEYV